jgi:hypothetical protein
MKAKLSFLVAGLVTLLTMIGLNALLQLFEVFLNGAGVSREISGLVRGMIFFAVGSLFVYWWMLKILQGLLRSHCSDGEQIVISCTIFIAALLVAEIPLIEFTLEQTGLAKVWWSGTAEKAYLLPMFALIPYVFWRSRAKTHSAGSGLEEK